MRISPTKFLSISVVCAILALALSARTTHAAPNNTVPLTTGTEASRAPAHDEPRHAATALRTRSDELEDAAKQVDPDNFGGVDSDGNILESAPSAALEELAKGKLRKVHYSRKELEKTRDEVDSVVGLLMDDGLKITLTGIDIDHNTMRIEVKDPTSEQALRLRTRFGDTITVASTDEYPIAL